MESYSDHIPNPTSFIHVFSTFSLLFLKKSNGGVDPLNKHFVPFLFFLSFCSLLATFFFPMVHMHLPRQFLNRPVLFLGQRHYSSFSVPDWIKILRSVAIVLLCSVQPVGFLSPLSKLTRLDTNRPGFSQICPQIGHQLGLFHTRSGSKNYAP